MIKNHALIPGLIAILFSLGTREVISQIRPKSVRVFLYNETTTLPFVSLFRLPVHPGFTVGGDFRIKSGKLWERTFGVDLTFYHHKMSENSIMLDAMYCLGFKPGLGLKIKIITGAGYKHSFLPGDVFKFDTGEYHRIRDWGMSQFSFKLGYGLEYQINEKFSLIADQKFMIAFPYSESLPFSAHSFTGLGMKMYLIHDRRKENKQN